MRIQLVLVCEHFSPSSMAGFGTSRAHAMQGGRTASAAVCEHFSSSWMAEQQDPGVQLAWQCRGPLPASLLGLRHALLTCNLSASQP